MTAPKVFPIPKECLWCGEPVSRKGNVGPHPKYCSKPCYARFTDHQRGFGPERDRRNAARRDARQNNPIKSILQQARHRSKRNGVGFNLTQDWYLAHFSQGCEMTGIDLVMKRGSPWSAEIDRIKPGGDYTMDNCRIVCAIYNAAKKDWRDEDVTRMANAIKRS